jgi:hypothetical protein
MEGAAAGTGAARQAEEDRGGAEQQAGGEVGGKGRTGRLLNEPRRGEALRRVGVDVQTRLGGDRRGRTRRLDDRPSEVSDRAAGAGQAQAAQDGQQQDTDRP